MFKPKHNTVLTDVTTSNDLKGLQAAINQQAAQIAAAQQQMGHITYTASSGTSIGAYNTSGTTKAGSITTYGGGINASYWGQSPYVLIPPSIDPESIINLNGSELKVKDLVSRLTELEEKFKNLKFQMELMKP